MIRRFKNYNQYYNQTFAYVYTFGRYDANIILKRIKPKTNALIFTNNNGEKIVLASGMRGINKYLKLHEEMELDI